MATRKSQQSQDTTKTSVNPFAVQTKKAKSGGLDVVEAPQELAEAVDSIAELKSQISSLETELKAKQSQIEDWAKVQHSERVLANEFGNFRIQGQSASLSWICQDRSSGFDQDAYQEFVNTHGQKAADALLELDYASFRLNPEAVEKAKDRITQVLGKLSEEIGVPVLQPGHFKAKKNALANIRLIAKTVKDIGKLIDACKLVKFFGK